MRQDAVLPIALGANWLYALPSSEGLLLVDAGPDYPGSWDELVAQLDVHGYAVGDVRRVVITHAHVDHAGLAARWQELGAEVCGSADEVERFGAGMSVGWYDADLVLRLLDDYGVPEERLGTLRETFPPTQERLEAMRRAPPETLPSQRWPGMLWATPFQPDRVLREGDVVAVGERSLRFVPTPGHTPGDSVYYEEARGALFSGDHLLPRITSTPGIHFHHHRYEERMRSLPEQARSLERVRALGARQLYPGHGDATADVAGVAERTMAHRTKRQQRILRYAQREPSTPYAVLTRFFPHLPDRRLRQAMAEVVGQIDALVEAGLVEERSEDGVVRIAAVASE
jgi:glyoxylase-like metal-dependent hydrolase (beta-lactamase superfamily II)